MVDSMRGRKMVRIAAQKRLVATAKA